MGLVLAGGEGKQAPAILSEAGSGPGGAFLDGLLGAERRKAGWMWLEAEGDPKPWRQQTVLGLGRSNAGVLCGEAGSGN